MFKLIAENIKGEQLQLTQNEKYIVIDVDGLVGQTAVINTSVSGISDGSIFNSSRTNERDFVFTILPRGQVEKNRIALYRFFHIGKYCKMYYINNTREVFVEGFVSAIEGDLFQQNQSINITLRLPEPYFKSMHEVITDISSNLNYFVFPFAIDAAGIPFSEITTTGDRLVINSGDVESGIIIELIATGAVTNPAIYDEQGNSFKFKNLNLQDGDRVVINTYRGELSTKLHRAGVESNLISKVDNPTWFKLAPGDNLFSWDCERGANFLNITYKHRDLYEGV